MGWYEVNNSGTFFPFGAMEDLSGKNISVSLAISGTAVTVGSVAFWGMGGYVHANEIGLIVGNSIPTASFAGTQTAITKLVSA